MRPPFVFKQFTKDHGHLAQLQEWANHYGVKLTWKDSPLQEDGTTTVTSYPIVQGYAYHDFPGTGSKQNIARGVAAEKIIACPGVLDEARGRALR